MRYLLDTTICIYIAKQKPAEVAKRFDRTRPGSMAISLITFAELRFGAQKSSQSAAALRKLEQFTADVPVLPLDKPVASFYARTREHLQQAGTPISNNDLWIAAHCLQLGFTLVTNNVREFARVPDLNIENWTDQL